MKTILVVDDDREILVIIKSRLEASDYKVITAADGKEAINMVKEHNPSLIIMDIMMPNMDGIKACALIKADSRFKKIPIIILTASATESDRKVSEEVGANDYCTKPLNMAELKSKVDAFLNPPTFT
jgi:DNA-binding response OmpR family regulator